MSSKFIPLMLGGKLLATRNTVRSFSNEEKTNPSANLGSVGITASPPPKVPFVSQTSKGGMLLNEIQFKHCGRGGITKKDTNKAGKENINFVF